MNTSDVLKYGHDFVFRNLHDFPESEWETLNVCGWWSSKLIIAHLTSFEHLLVEVLNSFTDGAPTPYLDQFISMGGEQFNNFQVDIRKDKSAAEVLDELTQAHRESLELVARIPEDTLRRPGTLPWYGDEYSLEDFVCYQYYGHKREHTAQINVFKDFLKGVHPPLRS